MTPIRHQCSHDRYWDSWTSVCLPCKYLCDKRYQTPADCQRNCPNYLEEANNTKNKIENGNVITDLKPLLATVTVTMHSTTSLTTSRLLDLDDVANTQLLLTAVLATVLVLLVVCMIFVVLMTRFGKFGLWSAVSGDGDDVISHSQHQLESDPVSTNEAEPLLRSCPEPRKIMCAKIRGCFIRCSTKSSNNMDIDQKDECTIPPSQTHPLLDSTAKCPSPPLCSSPKPHRGKGKDHAKYEVAASEGQRLSRPSLGSMAGDEPRLSGIDRGSSAGSFEEQRLSEIGVGSSAGDSGGKQRLSGADLCSSVGGEQGLSGTDIGSSVGGSGDQQGLSGTDLGSSVGEEQRLSRTGIGSSVGGSGDQQGLSGADLCSSVGEEQRLSRTGIGSSVGGSGDQQGLSGADLCSSVGKEQRLSRTGIGSSVEGSGDQHRLSGADLCSSVGGEQGLSGTGLGSSVGNSGEEKRLSGTYIGSTAGGSGTQAQIKTNIGKTKTPDNDSGRGISLVLDSVSDGNGTFTDVHFKSSYYSGTMPLHQPLGSIGLPTSANEQIELNDQNQASHYSSPDLDLIASVTETDIDDVKSIHCCNRKSTSVDIATTSEEDFKHPEQVCDDRDEKTFSSFDNLTFSDDKDTSFINLRKNDISIQKLDQSFQKSENRLDNFETRSIIKTVSLCPFTDKSTDGNHDTNLDETEAQVALSCETQVKQLSPETDPPFDECVRTIPKVIFHLDEDGMDFTPTKTFEYFVIPSSAIDLRRHSSEYGTGKSSPVSYSTDSLVQKSDTMEYYGINSAAYVSDDDSSHSLVSNIEMPVKQMYHETTEEIMSKYDQVLTNRNYCESYSGSDDLDLDLLSCNSVDGSTPHAEHIHHLAEQSQSAETTDHWELIKEVYRIVKSLMPRMNFILGCVISSERLEVIIGNGVDDNNTFVEKIYEEVPEHLHNFISFSSSQPSVKLCCGKYGAGCMVTNQVKQMAATMTLVGSYTNRNYVYTVGHFLEVGNTCHVDCKCDVKKTLETGECIASLGKEVEKISTVKDKYYDIGLIRMNQQLPQENIRRYYVNGIMLEKICINRKIFDPIDDEIRPGTKFLILGGPNKYTFEAKIVQNHCARDQLNFFQLRGIDNVLEILPGHSGSLVTTFPDPDGVVQAVACVVGYHDGYTNHSQAMAVPFWDGIEKMQEQFPSLKNMLEYITFEDQSNNKDSAYFSSPSMFSGDFEV